MTLTSLSTAAYMQRKDLNLHHRGYEPRNLPLIYPAINKRNRVKYSVEILSPLFLLRKVRYLLKAKISQNATLCVGHPKMVSAF